METSLAAEERGSAGTAYARGHETQTVGSLARSCGAWGRAHELLCQMLLPRDPLLELFARVGPAWTGNLIPGAHAFEWHGGGQRRCWFWDFDRGAFVHSFASEHEAATLITSALLESHGRACDVSLLALDAVRDGLKAAERRDLISVVRVARILSAILDQLMARVADEGTYVHLERTGA